jgi:segregation and condensation protein A
MEYVLENFTGPLDVLLMLITKHKLDILDIEINILLTQYLEYLETLQKLDYDDIGEFLEMASRLIYIKTVSLLPKSEESKEEKQKLSRELVEYADIKAKAEYLNNIFVTDIYTREPLVINFSNLYKKQHSERDLRRIYKLIPEKIKKQLPVKERFDNLQAPLVSIIAKGVYLLRKLLKVGQAFLDEIYSEMTTRSEKVAVFLAILELIKTKRIVLVDNSYLEIRMGQKPNR